MSTRHTTVLDEGSFPTEPGSLPALRPADLVPAGRRAVVVAPHPDDEVLGVGGLLARLADLGRELLIIAVTDGIASHPSSTRWPPQRLATARPRESMTAWRRLGLHRIASVRAGFPDGAVAAHGEELIGCLVEHLRRNDTVFTTWREDGHPDHDAVGRACARAGRRCGARLVEYPVWHGSPGTADGRRLPAVGAYAVLLDRSVAAGKRHAVAAFRSQLEGDPSTGRRPILPPALLNRLVTDREIVIP